jgi:hypothetical protein
LIIYDGIYVEKYEVRIWSNGFLLHNIAPFKTGILVEQVLAKNKHQHCNISYAHS